MFSYRIWLPDGWTTDYWVHDSSFSEALSLLVIFVPLGKPLHPRHPGRLWLRLFPCARQKSSLQLQLHSSESPLEWLLSKEKREQSRNAGSSIIWCRGSVPFPGSVGAVASEPELQQLSDLLVVQIHLRRIQGTVLFFTVQLVIDFSPWTFLLGQARKIRRIISGICAIQLPWLCLRDYRGINVVHLKVKTETTEPWVLTSVPLLIHVLLTILCLIHCLFHVNILLNHSIKRLQRGRILTYDQKL